ncbi:hypothetical protein L2E82_49795 [Cichorium intybus]|uniref:Uncharacterized protein n=1 Tax=Cichorium intybus TaxID=13427 RepID=A0ACB8Z245_CICIN|nr:hypothetical protein L2E82_49795 [Cichorium intybus]
MNPSIKKQSAVAEADNKEPDVKNTKMSYYFRRTRVHSRRARPSLHPVANSRRSHLLGGLSTATIPLPTFFLSLTSASLSRLGRNGNKKQELTDEISWVLHDINMY